MELGPLGMELGSLGVQSSEQSYGSWKLARLLHIGLYGDCQSRVVTVLLNLSLGMLNAWKIIAFTFAPVLIHVLTNGVPNDIRRLQI